MYRPLQPTKPHNPHLDRPPVARPIIGKSEKQIVYAENIRRDRLLTLEWLHGQLASAEKDRTHNLRRLLAAAIREDDATFWIAIVNQNWNIRRALEDQATRQRFDRDEVDWETLVGLLRTLKTERHPLAYKISNKQK